MSARTRRVIERYLERGARLARNPAAADDCKIILSSSFFKGNEVTHGATGVEIEGFDSLRNVLLVGIVSRDSGEHYGHWTPSCAIFGTW
jgi:hypothetical protein